MPSYRIFNSVFTAGDYYDQVAAERRTVAAMLFFQRQNGSVGGGPFFVWSSEEGEAMRMVRAMPRITGLTARLAGAAVKIRNYRVNRRADALRGTPGYHQRAHAEELLVQDFPTCLGVAGAATVRTAHISISKSPCIGGLDGQASANFGVVHGCYNKLLFLAARNQGIRFEVSFDALFGHFQGSDGPTIEAYLNGNTLSDNIEFSLND